WIIKNVVTGIGYRFYITDVDSHHDKYQLIIGDRQDSVDSVMRISRLGAKVGAVPRIADLKKSATGNSYILFNGNTGNLSDCDIIYQYKYDSSDYYQARYSNEFLFVQNQGSNYKNGGYVRNIKTGVS